ncbi:MAG: hypothetical protein KDD70_03050 [Bdellovibrionales bacterium]|nr:hypothetical protein [Bdellovibrionales bacterium]
MSLARILTLSSHGRAFQLLLLGIVVLNLAGCIVRTWSADDLVSYSYHLRKAEEYQRQGNFGKAIEAYEQHIASRLEIENRPKWENPYFYNLLIGDLYLKEELIEKALAEYEYAQKQNVSEGLVSDRFRLVANWLAEHDRIEEAIEILNKYRSSDPLLYDLMRDRLARTLVEREEEKMSERP